MKRVPEPEIMDDLAEVVAYDELVSDIQGEILDRCFAKSLANLQHSDTHDRYRLLDVCTGPARIPVFLTQLTDRYDICAMDISKNMIDVAVKNKQLNSASYHLVQADAHHLPFPDGHFDVASCHASLHHFKDAVPVLKEINRVTKPKGSIMIRDLRRPVNMMVLRLYLMIFGAQYNQTQKKLYNDSLGGIHTGRIAFDGV